MHSHVRAQVFRQVSGILAAAYSSRLDMAEALEDFARLVDRFEAIAAEDALDDEELGEIPGTYVLLTGVGASVTVWGCVV
eukprot:m.1131920 g.1131920  ORF g.1131920 m.1131920 type:complete len:80 (+) comp24425_c0_seq10:3003-3242(+)